MDYPHVNDPDTNLTFRNQGPLNFTNFAQRRDFERSIGHIVGPAFVLMNILSLIANVVILVVLFRRGVKSRTTVIIINLGINDVLLLCIGTPWKLVSYVSDTWLLGTAMCKLAVYGLMLSLYVEVYTLLLLSFLRYVAISRPLNATVNLTRTKVYLLIGAVWISAILINVPTANYATLISFAHDNESDVLCMKMAIRVVPIAEKIYGQCYFILTYTVPLVVIFSLLGASIKNLNRSKVCISGMSKDNRKRHQAIMRLVALTFIYAICVFPINVLAILRFMVRSETRHSQEFIIADVCAMFFAFSKCSLHPMMYNCMAKDFRKDVIKLIKRQSTCSNDYTKRCTSDTASGQYVKVSIDNPVVTGV